MNTTHEAGEEEMAYNEEITRVGHENAGIREAAYIRMLEASSRASKAAPRARLAREQLAVELAEQADAEVAYQRALADFLAHLT